MSPSTPDLDPDDSALLARFYGGRITEDERDRAEALVRRLPAEQRFVANALEGAMREHVPTLQAGERDAAVKRLQMAIQTGASKRRVRVTGSSRRLFANHLIRGTLFGMGTIVILAFAAFGIWTQRTPSDSISVSMRRYTTTTGQRATITLSDGSRVTLAPRTTLGVPRDFGVKDRSLTLDGEALFVVSSSAKAPFLVHTGNVVTRALGTTFDIRRYAHDSHVRVAVTEGKVIVAATTRHHPSVVLVSGSVGVVTDSVAGAVTGVAEPLTTWTDGQLVFDRAPVAEVLSTLERWYGYTFTLADSAMATERVTTTLVYGDPRQTFSRLKLLLDVEVTIHGDSVTLRRQPRNTRTPESRRDRYETFSPKTEVGR